MSKQFTDFSYTLPATDWAAQMLPEYLFKSPAGQYDPQVALRNMPGLQGWYDENAAAKAATDKWIADRNGMTEGAPTFSVSQIPEGSFTSDKLKNYVGEHF